MAKLLLLILAFVAIAVLYEEARRWRRRKQEGALPVIDSHIPTADEQEATSSGKYRAKRVVESAKAHEDEHKVESEKAQSKTPITGLEDVIETSNSLDDGSLPDPFEE